MLRFFFELVFMKRNVSKVVSVHWKCDDISRSSNVTMFLIECESVLKPIKSLFSTCAGQQPACALSSLPETRLKKKKKRRIQP